MSKEFKKKGKKTGKRNKFGINKKVLTEKILGLFTNNSSKLYNYKQIAKSFDIADDSTKGLITAILYELRDLGTLVEVSRGKFKFTMQGGYITGTVDLTAKGTGYIVSDESDEDVFVSQSNLNHALNGDEVKVYLYAKKRGRQPEGEVVEIIKKSREHFVGVVEVSKNFAFMTANNRQMPYDVFIPLPKLKGALSGDKVIVKITEWPEKYKNPFGEVVNVLGKPGENETEMHAILAEFDLPYEFDKKVEDAANNISEVITEADLKARRDFRDITTFTIDPADAKDFDDALSIQKLENGNWEVGVHIADVTHYVTPESIVEREAFQRATSVYLVDRVVPMIPEKLSNMVCSLRPNEEKLCYSIVFELDNNADVLDQWIGRTVINSNKRFDYAEAQALIEGGEGVFKEELLLLNDLAQKIRARRFKNGAISFDRVEVKFEIDEKGKPLGVYFKEQKESNKLIEEFMLLANKRVAEFIGKTAKGTKAKTFVYRIHDKPDPEKLERFSKFIQRFGYGINTSSQKNITSSINDLLDQVQGKKEQNVIETLAVRSMAKAVYSTKNVGHYGLSFSHYSHFTSPIRRYPDMMVHRMLTDYINGGKSKEKNKYEDMCKHSSERERKAAEAERSSIKYKQVEFMKDHIGEDFDGIISGVTEWGFYVELNDSKCEGLVHIRELDDDYYFFDEDNYSIIGRRNKKTYQLGDPVRITIVRADLEKKQLDYTLA
ncbi:MAG: ribonuclease R [Bacteroidales bacterium]|jgi:ribonuclease R|nr:ribonuclease R [Bacteroidales bacterium]